jgi:hypothetical protein
MELFERGFELNLNTCLPPPPTHTHTHTHTHSHTHSKTKKERVGEGGLAILPHFFLVLALENDYQFVFLFLSFFLTTADCIIHTLAKHQTRFYFIFYIIFKIIRYNWWKHPNIAHIGTSATTGDPNYFPKRSGQTLRCRCDQKQY